MTALTEKRILGIRNGDRRARAADGVGPGHRRRAGPRLRRGRAGRHGRVVDLGARAVRAASARPPVRVRLHPPRRGHDAAAARRRRRLARTPSPTGPGWRPGGRAPGSGASTTSPASSPARTRRSTATTPDRPPSRCQMMDYLASITYRNPVPAVASTGPSRPRQGAPPARHAVPGVRAGLRRRARATARSTPSSSAPEHEVDLPADGHDHQLHDRHPGAVPRPDRDRAVRPGLRAARRHRRRSSPTSR